MWAAISPGKAFSLNSEPSITAVLCINLYNLFSLQKATDVLSVNVLLDQSFGPLFFKHFMLQRTMFHNTASGKELKYGL